MKKLGMDIDEYRKDARRRQERAEDMQLKYEANEIAANNVKIARRALWVSVGAAAVSLIALMIAALK